MGITQSSDFQQPRRRPSIHSGKLYISSLAEKNDKSEKNSKSSNDSNSQISFELKHKSFNSQDFDKSASELKEVLPDNLKAYNASIEVMYRFWYSEIEKMTDEQFKEAAVLLYVNIFKHIPDARLLFNQKNKNIELQAKQFFGMFRWLITNLRQPDPDRLMKRIRILGGMHAKMNIKAEWYSLFLLAFHETMIDTLKEKYTPRIRFCMDQLYTVVMNIMISKDFESLSSAKISHFIKACKKLETCLADTEAKRYLQMYMEQQFCVELILFYTDYRTFKNSVSKAQRQIVGRSIMKKYIDNGAECEINISWTTRDAMFNQMKANNDAFAVDVFDAACKETVDLIQQNIWIGFKKSIMKHAVDADINYDDIMKKSNSALLQLATPNYGDAADANENANTPSKSGSFTYSN